MRICIDLQSCQNGSWHRGIGRYTLSLTKAMIRAGGDNEFFIVLSDRFPKTASRLRRELEGLVPQERILVCSLFERTTATDPDNAWRNRAAELMRRHFIASLEPDIVFVPSLFEGFWDQTVTSIDAAPYFTAVTLHDLIPLEDPDRYISAQNDRDAYFRKLRDVQQADLIIAISSYVADEAQRRLSIDPSRVVVALNGIDETFRRPAPGAFDRSALMARLGITRPFIFNASPLEHRKNLEGLIAGFATLPSALRDRHQLVVAGKFDAYARRYLGDLATAEGLAPDALVLPGYVSDQDLVRLYASCALFAFSSWSEGFGLPPLEAMACGAPVVCANTTSLPEVIGRQDLLFDPRDPSSLGKAMARVLADPALADSLRNYGLMRAEEFTWRRTAETILAAFTRVLASRGTESHPPIAVAKRTRIAFVCAQMQAQSHLAGRVSGLIVALSRYYDVTLVTRPDEHLDPWSQALVEHRDLAWLDWNASYFDQIIYAVDRCSGNELAQPIANLPGLLLLLHSLDEPEVGVSNEAALQLAVQRGLFAQGGLGALAEAVAKRLTPAALTAALGANLETSALLVLREGEDGLPLLPLVGDGKAATAFRAFVGVPDHVPLVVAIAHSPSAAAHLVASFRSAFADAPEVHLALHIGGGDQASRSPRSQHLQGGIRRLSGPLGTLYRGMLSAANLVLLATDLPPALHARLGADVAGLGCRRIDAAEVASDLPVQLRTWYVATRSRSTHAAPLVSQVSGPVMDLWVETITSAVARLAKRPPSLLSRIEIDLPGSVRGKRPNSHDLGMLSTALVANAAYERTSLICIDISTFASPGSIRRLDPLLRAQLYALLQQGGTAVCPVYDAGGHFCTANQFVLGLTGLRNPELSDEVLHLRPGDKILALECFFGFSSVSLSALEAAWERGAQLLFCDTGETIKYGGRETGLADLVLTWAGAITPSAGRCLVMPAAASTPCSLSPAFLEILQRTEGADLPLQALSLAPVSLEALPPSSARVPLSLAEASPSLVAQLEALECSTLLGKDSVSGALLHYTVMGHLLGSYSLAIINRAVAATLEQVHPGRTHFLPFETDPIHHTEGVPPEEQPLMIELCQRPRPSQEEEVVISQHWPVMAPKGQPRLALALFPWEESHLPHGLVQTLNIGFDAIISPAQFVTDALRVSGTRIPVATIGQPIDLAPFHALARTRLPKRPIRRFLHISSCFPRKGVDVLLAAWAKAFTASDGVTLVIKTFPNPHNDVEAQAAALRETYPELAPIEIFNRDASREEMPAFYAEADAMVLPSRGEGYNLPALEAMAAGLPLIVTGHGGQRDFCGPEQARLINFRFARSGSHVTGSCAMWLEPDVDDLARALREYANPANVETVERRRLAALAAAAVEGDNAAWVRRFDAMVRDLLKPRDMTAPRIGWVTTWKVQCGIAQYSGFLLDNMTPAVRQNITLFCDDRTPSVKGEINYTPVWKVVGNKACEIATAVHAHRSEALLVQHQDGLISWEQLGRIGHDPSLADIVTIAILHNARNLRRVGGDEAAMVVSGLGKMTRVLVHNIDDMNFLRELGLRGNLGLLPHGASVPKHSPWPRDLGPGDTPVLGCHGFFFRHKGIDMLIRAAALLRREWPGLRLRLVNARFPGGDHDQTIEDCRRIAAEVGMEGAIDWHLDFQRVEEVERLLSGCDLIVLPYHESDDSASGAVRTSLATMVPLVATRVKIFAELGQAAAWAETNDPAELVNTIAPLLRSPEKRREIQAGMHAWLNAHDWQRIGTTLEHMIMGLVQQKRLMWNSSRNNAS